MSELNEIPLFHSASKNEENEFFNAKSSDIGYLVTL